MPHLEGLGQMVGSRVVAGAAALATTVGVLIGLSLGGSAAGAATGPMPPPTPVASQPGSVGVPTPVRALDTRNGVGAPAAPVGPNQSVVFTVTGQGSVPPSGVGAVWLDVTVLGSTAGGTINVLQGGTGTGLSTVTFTKAASLTKLVLASVDAAGQAGLRNASPGTLSLVADVVGYVRAGTAAARGSFQPVTPNRILDTRSGLGAPRHAVAANGVVALQVTGRGGVPTMNVGAVVLNLTVLFPTQVGRIIAYPAGTTRPTVANLSFAAGDLHRGPVIVPVGANGMVDLANVSAGTVHLVADVFAYVRSGVPASAGTYGSVKPTRILDTRSGLGAPKVAVGTGRSVSFRVTGRAAVPTTNVSAAVLMVTAVAPSGSGAIIAWGDGRARPVVSSLRFTPGQNATELVVVPVGADGKVALANNSSRALHLVADVAGYLRSDVAAVFTSTSRYVRNLNATGADVTTMHDEGCGDAQRNGIGGQRLVLLDIGGQNMVNGGYGVQLTAVSQTLTDAQLVTAVNGYVDGYASCRAGTDPAYIAVATNNDGNLRDGNAGQDWADNVIDPIAAHAAANEGMVIAGANDVEPDFTGLESEAEAWTTGFLGATTAPYVFAGAASGCPTTSAGGTCNWGWTQANFYNLAHGLSPSRILALPQIYVTDNATQWKYISLAGASGADRIDFIGALSEYTACQQPGAGCNIPDMLTAPQAWQALRTALSSSAAVSVQRLPISTDLRIDAPPNSPLSAYRVQVPDYSNR